MSPTIHRFMDYVANKIKLQIFIVFPCGEVPVKDRLGDFLCR